MLSRARLCLESMSDNVLPAAQSAVGRLPRRAAGVCLGNPWGGSASRLLLKVHEVIFTTFDYCETSAWTMTSSDC